VRTVIGRLSDLGLVGLLKLFTSAGVEGKITVETPAGAGTFGVRAGEVAGTLPPAVLQACRARAGVFRFLPGAVKGLGEFRPLEEFLGGMDAPPSAPPEHRAGPAADPLAGLRESLAEVALPVLSPVVRVVSADPRPYRTLESDWRQRGWDLRLSAEPAWPRDEDPSVVIVHLPTSATLAGQEHAWLAILDRAAARRPPVPVVWVGGLSDPELRHQAISRGASFLLPGPAGEVGEAARWFREDVTTTVDRLLARRAGGADGPGEAFRDFFLALHMDATPGEVRASLLRLASSFFARGALLAVRDGGFESLGGYGPSFASLVHLPRGSAPLEDAALGRRPVALAEYPAAEVSVLARAVGARGGFSDAMVFPLLEGEECVALFIGDGCSAGVDGASGLDALFARSGAMLL